MAAGLGFKTFTTGEVLTAADVNGYLMQGVLVFASEAARDAAITSPQEGQFAFTKDNNSLWYYSGSAWVASGATGDIEGVTAGVGISGGGTSGTVTITNSMATEIDAKGDLIVGTGADTFARLAVGTDGYTIVADSSTATGLAYAAPAGGAFVGVKLFLPADQTIANATAAAVAFGVGSESIDTDAFHDDSTNNTRITIPAGKGGKYLVIASTNFVGNSVGSRELWVQKGATGRVIEDTESIVGTTAQGLTAVGIVSLADADYIQMYVEQNSGGNLNINGDFIQQTRFEAYFLGA